MLCQLKNYFDFKEGIRVATVVDVARYVLNHAGDMTTMKLQKLVYYCQAWSLAWDGVPLFDEDFQAWANGPVCPELFATHRGRFWLNEDYYNNYEPYPFNHSQVDTINANQGLKGGRKTAQKSGEYKHVGNKTYIALLRCQRQ